MLICQKAKYRRIIQKFNKGQFNLQHKPASGRIPMFPNGDTTVVDATQELMNSNVHGVTSAKIMAENVGCSKSTAYKYLCVNNYKPYKLHRVQEFLPSDFGLREAFAHRAMAELDFNDVLWTDEAYFYLNSNVNSIRGSAWSPAPVKVLHDQDFHSPKVLASWGFKTDFVKDPFFFDNSIKEAAYRDMLINHVEPQLRSHRCLKKLFFSRMKPVHTLQSL